LKGTAGPDILLRSDSNLQVLGYCDSDWGACPVLQKSLSGYFITLDGTPVSWRGKKQATVSRSLVEVEYRSMALTTSELIWSRSFLASLGIFPSRMLYCDSQAALHIARNSLFHKEDQEH